MTIFTLVQDQENDKENMVPINNFHKTLLAAKPPNNSTPPASIQPNTNDLNHARSPDQPDHVAGIMAPSAATNAVPPSPERLTICSNEQDNEFLAPSHIEQNELSAIAEDDENPEQCDHSCVFLQGSPSGNDGEPKESIVEVISTSQPTNTPPPLPDTSFQARAMNITASSSDTFHSITLDSPPYQQALKVPARSPSLLPAPVIEQKAAEPPGSKEGQPQHDVTTPLISSIPPSRVDTAAPPPVVHPDTPGLFHTQDFKAPRGDESTPLSPKSSEQNLDVSLYPVLPAPMPLRKSMRAPRDPSMGAGPLGTTTPGAPLGGKRTSWLKKAREVKALEGTSRNIATLGLTGITQPHIPFLTNPLKRKSGDMVAASAITGLEDEERRYKSAKITDGNVAPLQLQIPQVAKGKDKDKEEQPPMMAQSTQTQTFYGEHEGMLDRLKKTVEGLGARVGKSMGKSLGAGAAGSALAEARAAAEARVAERNNKDEESTRVVAAAHLPDPIVQPVETLPTQVDERKSPAPPILPSSTREAERRLSVSDLFPPNDGVAKIKTKASGKVFQIPPVGDQRDARRETGTTTPLSSPPTSRPTSSVMPSGPVFNKPPPVFIPPAPTSKPTPAANQSSAASATTAVVPEMTRPAPLTAQSTMESIKSDRVFDHDDDAWMPSTQDTEYFGSQDGGGQMNVLDDDDSWPLDEKLASGGAPWTFGGGKDDSITWSTAPSQTQKLDTVYSQKDQTSSTKDESVLDQTTNTNVVPGAFDVEMDVDEHEVSVMVAEDDADLEEMIMRGASTVSLVEVSFFFCYLRLVAVKCRLAQPTAPPRSQSQASMASSASSQSQAGFFGQASKLLNSALGTSKRGKPEVQKVLQMAAVAAKKVCLSIIIPTFFAHSCPC